MRKALETGDSPTSRRFALRARLALSTIAVLASGAACGPAAPDPQPNIILIVVDTLRADMVFVEGRRAETPNFDRLAQDGVTFTQAFSHAPMTLPSHASLFSSRAPFGTGVLNNGVAVPTELPLAAEWFSEHGYQTLAVTSLGTLFPIRKPGPERTTYPGVDRGFDTYDLDYWHMDTAVEAFERIRGTLDAIDDARPFFLFAHFSDPHSPYNSHAGADETAAVTLDGEEIGPLPLSRMTQWDETRELEPGRHVVEFRGDIDFLVKAFEWTNEKGQYLNANWEIGAVATRGKHMRVSIEVKKPVTSRLRFWVAESPASKDIPGRYVGEVEYMDRYIGELIDELQARGMYDSSVIVFTSDHGEALGERKVIGHVQHLHDEMLHVPLVIKLPAGHSKEGKLKRLADELIPHQDIVPTLLELASIEPLPGQRGRSIFEGGSPFLIAETHKPESRRSFLCFRDEEYKLILDPEADEFQLYDLKADPGETIDIFATRKDERTDWIEMLRAVAEAAEAGKIAAAELSPEAQENLKALGYGGGQE